MANPHAIRRTPGVLGPESSAPRIKFDARRAIARARKRANLATVIDLAILLAVNLMVAVWDNARIPFLSRDVSVLLVLLFNVAHVADWTARRVLPLWRARWIAASWSREERARHQF